jgi:hypothetical protein
VSGFGGSGSGINSVEEAKRLLYGVPPEDDPAEEHMRRFIWTVCGWTTVVVLVAAAPLYWLGDLASSIAVAGVTIAVLGAIVSIRRRNRIA